jgi:uncharacterized protein (TIGR00730 family)
MSKIIRISVFGSASPKPGEELYLQAYQLGCAIAEMHCDVLTGGYIGTMEAVSKGANESGGHVIGVTCDEIEVWRPVHPNQWIREEIRFKTLHERLVYLVQMCDLAVVLPGGIGTLAEASFFWNCNAIGIKGHRKIFFIGDAWRELLSQIRTRFGNFIPEKDWDYLYFCPDVDATKREINGLIKP